MQRQQLRIRDIEQTLEEITRYLSRNHDPRLERYAQKWRDAFHHSYGRWRYVGPNFLLPKGLYGAYQKYVAAYKTRGQRTQTPQHTEVIPMLPIPFLSPQYRTWIESIGGRSALRALPP